MAGTLGWLILANAFASRMNRSRAAGSDKMRKCFTATNSVECFVTTFRNFSKTTFTVAFVNYLYRSSIGIGDGRKHGLSKCAARIKKKSRERCLHTTSASSSPEVLRRVRERDGIALFATSSTSALKVGKNAPAFSPQRHPIHFQLARHERGLIFIARQEILQDEGFERLLQAIVI